MVKNLSAHTGDMGWIPGSEGYPGEGNGNPLQYFCLENPMDRGAWWATVHGVTESDMTEHAHTDTHKASSNTSNKGFTTEATTFWESNTLSL